MKRTLKRELKVLEIVEREEMVSPRVRPGTRLHWLLPEYTGRWSACVCPVVQLSGLLPVFCDRMDRGNASRSLRSFWNLRLPDAGGRGLICPS